MTGYKATPYKWRELEEFSSDDANACVLELRARVEALEAQANHSPGATKMVPPPVATEDNKTPMIRLCAFTGNPPAPHEKWEDWFLDVLKTRTLEGVRVRAIAPEDFSFATPPPVATDEELANTWHKTTGGTFLARRAIYNLGVTHGQAGCREVAEPAPVAGGLVERVAKRLAAVYETGPYSREASKAAILEVVTWLREKGFFGAADLFKKEAGR